MLKYTFFLFAMSLFTKAFAYKVNGDSTRIVYARYDKASKAKIIPTDVFENKNNVLVIASERDTNIIATKSEIEIFWPSPNIDGQYELVLNSQQIYLRSSHDNPNPNFLYWIDNIDRQQFELIRNYLKNHADNNFRVCINKFSSRESYFFGNFKREKFLENNFADMLYDNLEVLIELLNKPLKLSNSTVTVPDIYDFLRIHPIRIITNAEQMREKFVLPVNLNRF